MKPIPKILTWGMMFIPALYLGLTWKNIPATVPMHYNLKGEVDRWGSKTELLILVGVLTVISFGTYLLLSNTHRFDPKRKSAEANKPKMKILAIGVSLFLSALNLMMIYYCSHPEITMNSNLVLAAVGLLFAFLGNYMHSIKPNYFAGFRLPWTLENEENWKLTHALAGKIWFGGGLLIAIVSLISPPRVAMITFIVIMVIAVAIPAVFSYRFFKSHSQEKI